MKMTKPRAIAATIGLTVLMAGCFFPPSEPDPAALVITDFEITPYCDGPNITWLCDPHVSGTVTNTVTLPPTER